MTRPAHKHRKLMVKIFLHMEWQYVAVTLCERSFDKAKLLPKARTKEEVECRKCLRLMQETPSVPASVPLSRTPYKSGWFSKILAKVGL